MPQRILIVGNAGSGKSQLAAQISDLLQLPIVELDQLYWKPGWKEADDSEFGYLVEDRTKGDAWIVEGNYSRFRHIFWSRVELLVVVDISLPRSLSRIVLRTFRRWMKKELCCNGNQETPSRLIGKGSLLTWAMRTNGRRFDEFPELIKRAAREGKQAVIIKTAQDIDNLIHALTIAP